MTNPTINFRLSPYQIGRGLKFIRSKDPTYAPSSYSHIVKMVYLELLASNSINRSDVVPPELMAETYKLLAKKKQKEPSFKEFIQKHEPNIPSAPKELFTPEEQSIIRSVSDFSPPTEWLDEDEEE